MSRFGRSSTLGREYTRLGRVYPAALDWLLSSEEIAQEMQSMAASFKTDSAESSFGGRAAALQASFDRASAVMQGIAQGEDVGKSAISPRLITPVIPAPEPPPSSDRHLGAT